MVKKPRILLLGNIKEDNSKSMHVYLDFLKKTLSKENIDILSPSSRFIPMGIFKNFIYPFIIPRSYDIYHIIDHSYGHLVYFLPKEKIIITCHDLIPLKFLEKMSLRAKALFNYYVSGLKRARIIIADSGNTKKDLREILKIPEKKVKVIPPLGFLKKKFNASKNNLKKRCNLKDRVVLLSVGNFFYKNTILILKAMKELEKIYNNLILIKIGGFSEEEIEFIRKNKLKNKVIVKKNLSQKEMEEIYYLSDMLVFPSLYEGFGIPPLEAMAYGTPVITSNVASLSEVIRDAAIKINPYSIEELEKAITKLIENKKFKESLVRRGYNNLKRFDKKEIAKKLMKVYKEVYKEILNKKH